jgi:hypothetical protein
LRQNSFTGKKRLTQYGEQSTARWLVRTGVIEKAKEPSRDKTHRVRDSTDLPHHIHIDPHALRD